jgi:MYXO-CTERM domain-containing protein
MLADAVTITYYKINWLETGLTAAVVVLAVAAYFVWRRRRL